MAVRQRNNNKRLSIVSSLSGKVAPTSITAPVHLPELHDQEPTQLRKVEEGKLAAGSHAAAENDYMEAIKQFSRIEPATITSLYLCGCARLELRQYLQTRKAISDFTSCLKFFSPTALPPFASELLYKRAFAHQTIGDNDDAISDFTQFIDQCRSLGEYGEYNLHKGLVGRGLTYQVKQEFDKAMKDIDEANQLTDDEDPYYLCCRAGVYASKNMYDKAKADLKKASEMGGNQDLEALFQRAFVFYELSNYDAALQDLARALPLSRKNIQRADIYFRRGLSEDALKQRENAFNSFAQAIKLDPFHARAYFHVGMIQAGKKQFKEALQSLSKAHELAPHQSDILFKRAEINQQLGKIDDALHDQKRAMQLGSFALVTVAMLEDRIKNLREEMLHNNQSPQTHLDLATALDGLLALKKEANAQVVNYNEAVAEYRAAIATDMDNRYPQARVLLALCQQKKKDFIQAHEWHLQFYDMVSEHKESVSYWKAFLEEVQQKKDSGTLEPHLTESVISELFRIERNRSQSEIVEEKLKNDNEDYYKNCWMFYQTFSKNLSDVFQAMALASLEIDIIKHNLKGTPGKIGSIIGLLSESLSFIPEIRSILSGTAKASAQILEKVDYARVKGRLEQIGSVGDCTEQIAVAKLVARDLIERYRLQLICLKPITDRDGDLKAEPSSSRRWWWCCCCEWLCSNETYFYDWNGSVEQVAEFAVLFIVKVISGETIKLASTETLSNREVLAKTFVLIVCRAHIGTTERVIQSLPLRENNYLSIDPIAVSKMLTKQQQPNAEVLTKPKKWDLYEFFRNPGIYYLDDKTKQFQYYNSGPSMKSDVNGYRLGTPEEINEIEKSKSRK